MSVAQAEEVVAATRRWIEKVVIGLNLFPFAEAVYRRDAVRLVVSAARHLDAREQRVQSDQPPAGGRYAGTRASFRKFWTVAVRRRIRLRLR